MPAKNYRPVTKNKLSASVRSRSNKNSPKSGNTDNDSLLPKLIHERAKPPTNAPRPSTALRGPERNSPTENRSSKTGAIKAKYGRTKILKIGVRLRKTISGKPWTACTNTFFRGLFHWQIWCRVFQLGKSQRLHTWWTTVHTTLRCCQKSKWHRRLALRSAALHD